MDKEKTPWGIACVIILFIFIPQIIMLSSLFETNKSVEINKDRLDLSKVRTWKERQYDAEFNAKYLPDRQPVYGSGFDVAARETHDDESLKQDTIFDRFIKERGARIARDSADFEMAEKGQLDPLALQLLMQSRLQEERLERLAVEIDHLQGVLARSKVGFDAVYTADYYPTRSLDYNEYILPAENGSFYGEISDFTYRPKTVYVKGYFRQDGTYVRSHYRSKPRD